MFFIGKKISRRLFSGLLLFALIPIGLMGYGIYKTAEDVVIRSAHMHIESIRVDHENHVDTWFGERLKDIQVISELPLVRDLCVEHCLMMAGGVVDMQRSGLVRDILAMTRAKSPSYKSMHIFSPSGAMLASTAHRSAGILNFDHKELFGAVQKFGEPVLGSVYQHSDQRWYMNLAAPIRTQERVTVAYTLAVLDASATLDPIMTDRAGLGKTGETYLVSKERRVITESRHLSRSQTLDLSLSSRGIEAAIEGNQGTGIYTNYMGRRVIGSYVWLPRYKWALLVEMEEDEILAPLKTIRAAVVMTTAAVGLFSLLLAFLMSRRVSLPIIRMAEASREMAEGRFDRRIPFTGADEIAVLSESFNSMAERLSSMITSLRQKEASLQKAYEELLEMQQQVVQSEKMAAIGELVASVVHEMRNPLCSVKLNLQIIGRSLDKGSLLSEHYRIAIDQVSQLERMFTDLMNYSQPLHLEKGIVSIERLVEESLRQLEPLVKEQEIAVVRNFREPLPPVWADPDKMRQVVVNVVKNAIEAAGRGGRVEIAGGVENANGKVFVILSVLDNGAGISRHDLKRVFQPFFTTKKKGTGLGLSIVRKVMEAHGYGITVSSEEAKGTAVHLQMQGAEDEQDSHH